MQIIAATNNKNKLSEIQKILENDDIKILSLKDVGLDIEIEETGETFAENALIKAREVSRLTGRLAIADDSGLEVSALNNEPGVKSARYSGAAGEEKNQLNNEKLKENMKNIKEEDRAARFCCVLAAVFPDGTEIAAEGYVYGKIGYEEKGANGFGYDPLFIVDGYNQTMAELSPEEKNIISHRAIALKNLLEKLKKIINL